jgi:hypothetical protein
MIIPLLLTLTLVPSHDNTVRCQYSPVSPQGEAAQKTSDKLSNVSSSANSGTNMVSGFSLLSTQDQRALSTGKWPNLTCELRADGDLKHRTES